MNSVELKGFLTGLVLGDGYLDKGIHKRAFEIKNTSKDFIDMIDKEISKNTNFKSSIKEYNASYRDGVNKKKYWIYRISAHPYFRKMYHYHYDDYRNRIITTKSLKSLTPQGIANWYMSDGYVVIVGRTKGIVRTRRVEICTDRYNPNDVLKAKKYFEDVHGLSMHMVKRKKDVYRLRFHLKTINKFFDMIEPYIVDDMKYKLDLCYNSANTLTCNDEG